MEPEHKKSGLVPVRHGEKYIVGIDSLNHEGQGIGHIQGYTVFVDGALPGETASIKVTQVKKSYAVATLQKLLEISQHRREPFCAVFNKCGGCSLQHLSYARQLEMKTEIVRGALKRIGDLTGSVAVHDTIGMADPFYYRNKAQYPVGIAGGRTAAGFYESRTHIIVENDRCDVQDKQSTEIRGLVINFMRRRGISAYDESTGEGLVRHIVTRKGFNSGEIMVLIVINGDSLPYQDEMVSELTGTIADIKSIVLNINTESTNVITGDKCLVIYGREYIYEYLKTEGVLPQTSAGASLPAMLAMPRILKFMISPLSFFQVNTEQTEILYSKVMEYAGLTGRETVFDIYCGTGTISLFLAANAKIVYGIEIVEGAARDARENALINDIENAEFIAGDAVTEVRKLMEGGIIPDVIVLDPPRKGCPAELLEVFVQMSKVQPQQIMQRIIYVSCDPATLARDIRIFSAGGYMVTEIQPVDMFPWTGHVETVVLMSRVNQ